MTPLVILLLSSISLIRYGSALQVTPGSTCAAFCLDNPESDPLNPASSNTTPRDITCTGSSYDDSATGIKFKNCLDCLQKSNATTEAESDVSWFLYNLRYSVDVCLFGFPDDSKAVSSPCGINWACQPLKTALEAGSLESSRDQFEYCSADGDFTSSHNIGDCIKCFASSPDQMHIANFMTALKAGCEQKPAPGELIGLSGSLFTGSLVNITSLPTEVSSNGKDSGFGITSTGAIVGISLGGGLLLFGGLALFWVYHRHQKRAFGRIPSPDNDPRTGNRSITPFSGGVSTAEKRTSPFQTGNYELRTQRSFTNNAEYYSMLEKEIQSNRSRFAAVSNHPMSGPQSVLPAHPAYLPRAHSRQASHELSLQPPRPIKTSKPDSYALQAYLTAAEDSGALNPFPPPPPGPPPAAVIGNPSRFRGPLPDQYPAHSRNSSTDGRGPSPDQRPLLNLAAQNTANADNLPPPPSTRPAKVPFLAFPSVPNIRMPKKYTPPRITVQTATPTGDHFEQGPHSNGQQRDSSVEPDASKTTVADEPQFKDSLWAKRRQRPPPLVIE